MRSTNPTHVGTWRIDQREGEQHCWSWSVHDQTAGVVDVGTEGVAADIRHDVARGVGLTDGHERAETATSGIREIEL